MIPRVVVLADRVPSLGRAVERFLAAKPLSANARRGLAYRLREIVSDLGVDTSLGDVSTEGWRRVSEPAVEDRGAGNMER